MQEYIGYRLNTEAVRLYFESMIETAIRFEEDDMYDGSLEVALEGPLYDKERLLRKAKIDCLHWLDIGSKASAIKQRQRMRV